MFGYTATSPYELSVGEGETVKFLEEDDGSGWVKVANNSGGKGLVPASYVEVVGSEKVSNVTPRTSAQYGALVDPRCPLPLADSHSAPILSPPPMTVIHGVFSQFAGCTIIRRRAKTRSPSRRGA